VFLFGKVADKNAWFHAFEYTTFRLTFLENALVMTVERIEEAGGVSYRLFSEWEKDSLAFSPKELLHLLVYLQDFEQQIIQDARDNREIETMLERGYTLEEIKHARELQRYGSTDITDLVLRKLKEGKE